MFSLIIPTCHRNNLLEQCLSRLYKAVQALDPTQYEVIISDDGDQKNAKTLVESKFSWCRWVQGPQKGPAKNRNHGVQQSSGKWIVFIDDDCLPDKALLLSYQKAIKDYPMVEVFEGCIKPDRPKQRFDEVCPVNLTGGYLWSCNFAVTRALFDKIGGFDIKFPYPCVEDVDFRLRLLNEEVKLEFLENAFVIHPWRKESNLNLVKRKFHSFIYLSNKHEMPPEKITGILYDYIRKLKHIFVKIYSFGGRGLLHRLALIHYLLWLKLNHLIRKKLRYHITFL
jgi:GT2 family glycosyltransferase